jgi:hypothetical protein
MVWRVEKHDMLAGQAHGCDLQQNLGLGSGVWMKGKGESGHAGRELSLARERGAMECFVEMMFESTVLMWLGNYVDVC